MDLNPVCQEQPTIVILHLDLNLEVTKEAMEDLVLATMVGTVVDRRVVMEVDLQVILVALEGQLEVMEVDHQEVMEVDRLEVIQVVPQVVMEVVHLVV